MFTDSDDKVTTLPVRPAPPSPDYVPASPDYPPDSNLDSDPSGDDLPGEDLTDTAESLPTQTTLTSIVHPPTVLLPPPAVPLPPSTVPPKRIELGWMTNVTTPSPSVTPHVGVLIVFIMFTDSDDKVTTLPIRPAPPSPDYVPASPDYSPDSNLDSDPSGDDLPGEDLTDTAETMKTTNQGLSFAEIEQIIAQRVVSAIETIVIYKEKTRMTCDSRNQVER
nr:hypothetical protein [Tanacetum cinerariifolium]